MNKLLPDDVDLSDPLRFKLWANQLSQVLTIEDWKAVTFQNSWANASGRTTRFYKSPFSEVKLTGRVDSGTNGTTAFTLPEGYRPDENLRFPAMVGTATLGYVDVNTDGTVVVSSGTSSGCSLDNISFRA